MNFQEDSFRAKLGQGHTALWEQDWEGAVSAYNEALADSPDHPVALASLGLALFQKKNYSDSLRIFQRLASRYPEDPMPVERSARIYEREGLLTEAVSSFNKAAELQLKSRDVERSLSDYRSIIRINPANQGARARVAMIYNKMGKKNEAAREFLDLAAIVQRSGNPDRAMQIVEYTLQVKPDSVEAKNAIGILKSGQILPLRDLGLEGAGAVRMAQVRSMETPSGAETEPALLDPLNEAKMLALKEIAGTLFDDPENQRSPRLSGFSGLAGNSQMMPGSEDHKRIQVHVSEAIALQTAGKNDQAAGELSRAIDLGLNIPGADYLLGYLLREKDPLKTQAHLRNAVQTPAYAMASYLIAGSIDQRFGKMKEAAECYLNALRLADRETVSTDEAEELAQLYDPIFESQALITQEKDLRNLCTAISNQLTRPDWLVNLKTAREQLPPQPAGTPPLPLAELLMDSNSSQVVGALAEVRKLAMEGMYRSAMEEAYRAISFAPTYLPLHIQIGEILVNQGRISDASEKFQQVARLYTIRGDSRQAIRLLTRVIRLAPMETSVRRSLIELLRQNGRYHEVIQQYMDLGNAHYLLAELDEARTAYNSALTISRQSWANREQSITILNRLADIELQSLSWKEATKVFEQLRSLLPGDPSPRITLIDLYFRLGMAHAALNEVDAFLKILASEKNFGTAEKFLDDLLVEMPENRELRSRMVDFYASEGKLDLAVNKLDAIAERLLENNDLKAAVSAIRQIIECHPSNQADYEKAYLELMSRQTS